VVVGEGAVSSTSRVSSSVCSQLEHFHRPYLAVDVALLTLLPVSDDSLVLHVLLVEVKVGRSTKLALPGVLLRQRVDWSCSSTSCCC
jgi:hypothetical protein